MRRTVAASATLLVLLLGAGAARLAPPSSRDRPVELDELRALVPSADRFERRSSPLPHWEATRASAPLAVLSRVVLSTDLCSVQGFGGPLQLLVSLGPTGAVSGVAVHSHRETPAYVLDVLSPEALRRFVGRDAADPFAPDAVSGATVSATALAATVAACARRVAREALGRSDVPEVAGAASSSPTGTWRLALAGLAVFLAALSWALDCRVARFGALASGAALGAAGVFLSMELLFPLVLEGRFDALRDPALALLLLLAVVAAALRGRLFCGTLCPLGAAQEALGTLAGRHGADDLRSWRPARFLVLGAVLVAAGLATHRELLTPDPIYLLCTATRTKSALFFLACIFAASLVTTRAWCRVLCPLGAALTGCGAAAAAPVRLVAGRCTGCGACSRACPMGALGEGAVLEAGDCIMCGICVRTCPSGALAMGPRTRATRGVK